MTYKTHRKKNKKPEEDFGEYERLKGILEMRQHIYQRIKRLHDKDLALLEEAEANFKSYIDGKKGKKATK